MYLQINKKTLDCWWNIILNLINKWIKLHKLWHKKLCPSCSLLPSTYWKKENQTNQQLKLYCTKMRAAVCLKCVRNWEVYSKHVSYVISHQRSLNVSFKFVFFAWLFQKEVSVCMWVDRALLHSGSLQTFQLPTANLIGCMNISTLNDIFCAVYPFENQTPLGCNKSRWSLENLQHAANYSDL